MRFGGQNRRSHVDLYMFRAIITFHLPGTAFYKHLYVFPIIYIYLQLFTNITTYLNLFYVCDFRMLYSH